MNNRSRVNRLGLKRSTRIIVLLKPLKDVRSKHGPLVSITAKSKATRTELFFLTLAQGLSLREQSQKKAVSQVYCTYYYPRF